MATFSVPPTEIRASLVQAGARSDRRDVAGSLIVRSRTVLAGPVAPAWRHVPIIAFVLMMVAVGLQPALPEEEQSASAAEAALGWAILAFVFASYTVCALIAARGSRAGLILSLPATLLMLAIVVACPASGHHSWGLWVAGSFGAAILAAALHVASLRATPPSARITKSEG
jgi:hypothetical protein